MIPPPYLDSHFCTVQAPVYRRYPASFCRTCMWISGSHTTNKKKDLQGNQLHLRLRTGCVSWTTALQIGQSLFDCRYLTIQTLQTADTSTYAIWSFTDKLDILTSVQTLRDGRRIYEIASTQSASDVLIDTLHLHRILRHINCTGHDYKVHCKIMDHILGPSNT